jgi:PadR family transcriptional regulator, regulatory protein PadR
MCWLTLYLHYQIGGKTMGADTDSYNGEEFTFLSAIEEDIMTLLLGRGELYGLQISDYVQKASNGKRKLGIGSLYPTLGRMEKKGYVSARLGDEHLPERGGARRKYYRITAKGAAALTDTQRLRHNLANMDFASPLYPA